MPSSRFTARFPKFIAVFLLLVAALAPTLVSAATPPQVPIEAFFSSPEYRSLQLSPDGKMLAFLTKLDTGKVGLALMHLDTGKIEPLVRAKDENYKSFFWKGNDYIVYYGDIGGNESVALRSISIAKRKIVELSDSYIENRTPNANPATLIDSLKFDPYRVLVYGTKAAGSYNNIGLWFLDVRTGERRTAGSDDPKPDTQDRVVDNNGVIRARSYLLGDKIIYEVRPEPDSAFKKVAEFPADEDQWSLLSFAADNETLYLVTHDKTDTGAFHTLNVRTQQLSPVLYHRPDGEISNVIQSYDRKKLYAIAYETDKDHQYIVDQGYAILQATVDKSLPGTKNNIVSRSADEKVMVVVAHSDRDPGTYYVLDLRKPSLTAVGKLLPKINPADMQPMEPVSYQSRDGLTIHGYLTRPAGFESKPAPLIINPHGGPFGIRDDWGFNPEVQLLANRGYAVLQINYRGSGGYGSKFQRAGKREWGGKMQNDLSDGVKWAIAQDIADPDRVAIYGASYGGYAALAGVCFTPELYRCGVNYVGVSDLSAITSWGRRSDRGFDMFVRDWIGDDAAYKHDRSPVNFVDRIQVPTLHAYGYNDPRVEFKNWTRLESKLKEYNKPYEIIIEKDEGHGFGNDAHSIAFYSKLESFLAENMAPRKPAVVIGPTNVIEMPAKEKKP